MRAGRTSILAPGFWRIGIGPPAFFPPSPPEHPKIGVGKSYPVTAARLLPVFTGFHVPARFLELAKNWTRVEQFWRGSASVFSTGHCRARRFFQCATGRARLTSRLQSAPMDTLVS